MVRKEWVVDKGENDRNGRYAVEPVAANGDLHAIGSPLASASLGLRPAEAFDRLRSGIGFRLLAAVLLFSSLATLTLTALQLYLDYDHEVGVIETRLEEIGRNYLASIATEHDGVRMLLSGRVDYFCEIDAALRSALYSPEFKGVTSVRPLLTIGDRVVLYPFLYKTHADLAPRLAAVLRR